MICKAASDPEISPYIDFKADPAVVERLMFSNEKAEKLDDVIRLQSRITEVNYQLDSYKAQLRKYDDLIAYCTVHISVNEVFRESEKAPEVLTFTQRISQALNRTFLDISDGAQDFAVDFVASLPYLLIWAVVITVLILLGRFIWKKLRRPGDLPNPGIEPTSPAL